MNNKMHGQGRFESANGDRYEGGFSKGKRHGRGCYLYASGERVMSRWKNGKEIEEQTEEEQVVVVNLTSTNERATEKTAEEKTKKTLEETTKD